MGYQLTEEELHICWAITEMFNGDEIFYGYIVAQINSYPIEEIERLFFDCVAPVYHRYMFYFYVPLYPYTYKKEDVRVFINDYLSRPKYIFFPFKYIHSKILHWLLNDQWQILKQTIINQKNENQSISR